MIDEAARKQLPDEVRNRLARYAAPLGVEEPTYILLDGPMAFLRGGATDRYVTDGLDGGFVAGWRALVTMHDELRPLLLPPEEDQPVLPPLTAEATPQAGMDLVDDAIAVLTSDAAGDAVGPSVLAAMTAAREYFEAAQAQITAQPGLVRRGMRAVGGMLGLIVTATNLGAATVAITAWAVTPQGQAVIAALAPIFQSILKLFGG